jgi:hypothetical protein
MKRLLLLLMAATMLAGCLGDMPKSGPIGFGRENLVAPESNFVRTIVTPPVPGADPVGIVRGFMAASAGDSGTFATARLYLAPEVRDEWRPLSEIRVVEDRGMAWDYDNLRSPGLVRFSANGVGSINASGEYRQSVGAEENEFRLRLVNQEWRIASLPDGQTLSETELGRSYRSVAIYYPDRSGSVMVPNLLYLPVRPALPTSMVRALLRGPTPWLRPAVRSAIPSGTALQVNAVPVVDGVALIDLSENVSRASSADRALLSAQLVHTLKQVTDIRGIRITAGGVDLSVPGASRIQSINSWTSYSPDVSNQDSLLYFGTEDGLRVLSLANVQSQPQDVISSAAEYSKGLRFPSVSVERDRLIALDGSGSLVSGDLGQIPGEGVSLSGLSVLLPASARSFIRPRWDVSATYWVAVRGTRSLQVFAGRIGSQVQRVETPTWSTGVTTAFSISRDGTRAVVARTTSRSSSIYLMRVVRAGSPDVRLSLEEPLLMATLYGAVTDLVWTGGSQVAALGGQPGEQRQVWSVPINGDEAQPVGPPLAALSIAAGPGQALVAETTDQRIVVLRDQRWSRLTTGRDPSYSG